MKAEIIGTSHRQQNFNNVNVNLSYHSMTRCIDHMTVIIRLTIATKVCVSKVYKIYVSIGLRYYSSKLL